MKRLAFAFAAGLVTLAAVSPVSEAQSTDSAVQDSRILRGKQISPVTPNLTGKDASLVYLGSYLINAKGGCNDCHTCPSYVGTDPFQVGGAGLGAVNTPGPVNPTNYMAGGTPFGPGIVSYNLTPDSSGLPGGMTLPQFLNAIVNGIDSHDGGILQIMPWPTYRHMENKDLLAIYAYLSSLPSAQPGTCTGSGQTGQ